MLATNGGTNYLVEDEGKILMSLSKYREMSSETLSQLTIFAEKLHRRYLNGF